MTPGCLFCKNQTRMLVQVTRLICGYPRSVIICIQCVKADVEAEKCPVCSNVAPTHPREDGQRYFSLHASNVSEHRGKCLGSHKKVIL